MKNEIENQRSLIDIGYSEGNRVGIDFS